VAGDAHFGPILTIPVQADGRVEALGINAIGSAFLTGSSLSNDLLSLQESMPDKKTTNNTIVRNKHRIIKKLDAVLKSRNFT